VQAYGIEVEDWHRSALSVVVVGASGDLAKKKIFPALFALYHEGMLPEVRTSDRDLYPPTPASNALNALQCTRCIRLLLVASRP
jgi:hypothetical protein